MKQKSKFDESVTPANPVSSEDDVIDLGALIATIWRQKLLVAMIAAVYVIVGGYYAFFVAEPRYQSTAVVILETQEQSVVDLEGMLSGISADTTALNSEIEVLRSRGLLGKVVDKLDLTNDPFFNGALREPSPTAVAKGAVRNFLLGSGDAGPERTAEEKARLERVGAVNALRSALTVRNLPNTVVFEITATTDDAEKSALIADTLAQLYILNQLEVKFEATQQATAWLTDQVGTLRVELEDAEARLSAFSTDTELVSVETLQALERQLKDVRDRVRAGMETVATQSATIAALETAEGREAQAAAADDPQLQRLVARADAVATIGQAFDTRFEQVLQRARLDLARTENQLAALQQSQEELGKRIGSQSEDLITLQQLTREAEASRALYEYFLGRLKETSAQQGIQQADSRVLSNAVVALVPSEPRRSLIVAMSGMLGLLLGVGLVLLREARNRGFRTAGELEAATGYTVLGQIPRIPVRSRRKAMQYLAEKPSSNAAEAVRNLRTSVLLSDVDNPPQVILSTSAIPAEGKTTNSLALAQNLVGMGKRVVFLEGDIRRRVVSRYFDNAPEKGLVSVLAGEAELDDVIFQEESFGADIIAGESTSTNAADLFSSDRFRDLMATLRERYDVVVVDTPPVLVVPDARIMAQYADAVLFTVRWDSTSSDQVREALRLFEQSNQRITGFVLSQISPQGMKRYGYGGKYGAYGGYGASYYAD